MIRAFTLALLFSLPAQAAVIKGPYLQNADKTRVTVAWETDLPMSSQVSYGVGDARDHVAHDETLVTIHKIRLDGLLPGTLYGYDIPGAIPGTFRTFPESASGSFSFVVWGDSQYNFDIFTPIVARMASLNPAFAVSVGDLVYDSSSYESWAREFFGPTRELLSRVPFFVAAGNHDMVRSANGFWFDKFFDLPADRDVSAFTHGNTRFVLLNPYYSPLNMYRKLTRELNSVEFKRAKFHFVFIHEAPYSEAWSGGRYTGNCFVRWFLVPLLKRHRTDVIFSGHTHDYERGSTRDRKTYFVITGGGGGYLDDQIYKNWRQIQVQRFEHHFLKVDVSPTGFSVQAIGENGNVFDSFGK